MASGTAERVTVEERPPTIESIVTAGIVYLAMENQ